ncbi:hypothetical protein FDP41_007879 [Naegleria fowleri]|uniref:FAD-binding domain-containing protein n=1 Tax=Naegleria fowleri TaxID=5763 RepID=A0A6A5CBN5_NAEFO|nr:uncharacterized protein FDP41_007879 [Naegleria fowleri]KAF0983964.1 hypothetical protein FDP41_007879 [Naegleria fowleri]CAG4707715.1 unnamed protein product [Naegleria fowleri]
MIQTTLAKCLQVSSSKAFHHYHYLSKSNNTLRLLVGGYPQHHDPNGNTFFNNLHHRFFSTCSITFATPKIVGVSGQSVEGLVFSLALSQLNSTSNNTQQENQIKSIEVYSNPNPLKDEACILSQQCVNMLRDYCGVDVTKSPYAKNLSHYHIIRADIRNPITVMDLKHIAPPEGLYSIQKSFLLQLLLEKAQQNQNINLVNDNVRAITESNGKIAISSKKAITKRHVDLLVAAEEDIQHSTALKYLQSKLGNESTMVRSRFYECDSIIMPCPSDIDYESRMFEWWNNSSRLTIIPLPNQQLGLNSIQYIPKHSALGAERVNTNCLHFVFKIHSNLRDNGVDSVLDNMRQLFYTRDRVGVVASSKIAYDHELKQLYHTMDDSSVVAIGNVAHSVDPTLYQQTFVAIHDAVQLAIHLKEHGFTREALALYEQASKLSFDKCQKYSEGMATIGFKKRVNKITFMFKFILEKLNVMRFRRIVSKVMNE